jgi:hypothetical protein
MRQEQQQQMLRGLRGEMMPQQYQQQMRAQQMMNGMNAGQQNDLRQQIIKNNRNQNQ